MERTKQPKYLLILSIITFFAGCAPRWADPDISVHSIDVNNVRLRGATVRVELAVYNPNSVPLPFEEADFELRLETSRPVQGRVQFDAPLPPMETVVVPTDIEVSTLAATSLLLALSRGDGRFRLEGDMELEYRGHRRVHFVREGEIVDVIRDSDSR